MVGWGHGGYKAKKKRALVPCGWLSVALGPLLVPRIFGVVASQLTVLTRRAHIVLLSHDSHTQKEHSKVDSVM